MESKSFRQKYNGKSGIYIITPTWLFNSNIGEDEPFLVKIGESTYSEDQKSGLTLTGIAYRLDHYLAYFVEGFYIWGVFITDAQHSKALESSMHSYLKGKNRDFETVSQKEHSRSSEWFYLSKHDLSNILYLLTHDDEMKQIIQESYTNTTILQMNDKTATRVAYPMRTPQRRQIDRDNRIEFNTNERPNRISRILFN